MAYRIKYPRPRPTPSHWWCSSTVMNKTFVLISFYPQYWNLTQSYLFRRPQTCFASSHLWIYASIFHSSQNTSPPHPLISVSLRLNSNVTSSIKPGQSLFYLLSNWGTVTRISKFSRGLKKVRDLKWNVLSPKCTTKTGKPKLINVYLNDFQTYVNFIHC